MKQAVAALQRMDERTRGVAAVKHEDASSHVLERRDSQGQALEESQGSGHGKWWTLGLLARCRR